MFSRTLPLLAGFVASTLLTANAADSGEERFLSRTRQLIFEGKRSGEGYFSADGGALIYQSERAADNPFYQIYILNLDSGESHRVSPGAGKTTCSFFRPGTDEVLFASTHLDPQAAQKQKAELDFRASGKQRRYSWDYDDHMDIFVAHRDGSGLRQLTTAPGYDAEGAFSPDGKKIVFCSLRGAYPTNRLSAEDLKRLETDPAYFGDIYIMNADGSEQRRLTSTPGYDGGPFFSPDGERIVWRHFETNGLIADVYTMKLDGSDVRRITDFGCMSWAPFFHPSRQYLVFTANKLGFANFELFIVDAAGSHEPVRVTYTDGFDGLPSFSPDGKQLTWTSNRGADGKSQIFLAQWNHEAALSALNAAPTRTNLPPRTALTGEALRASLTPAQISVRRMSNDVGYLSAPQREGRMTGSPGAHDAEEFLGLRLLRAGARPFGEEGTFFQRFEFNAGVRVLTNENRLAATIMKTTTGVVRPFNPEFRPPPGSIGNVPVTNDETFIVEKDFRPLAFSDNGSVTGQVVFAGYGLVVPGKAGEGYDSYAGLDVSNKIVLALRYVPEEADAKRRQELNRYAGLRYKAMLARERGAKAILFVTGPTSPRPGELAALGSDSASGTSGIIAASVTTGVVAKLFAPTGMMTEKSWWTGHDLKMIQASLDRENPHAETGFTLSNVTVSITTAIEHIRKLDHNVLAVLAPTNAQEFVLLGAHLDHLGYGESGAMLRAGEENTIHPGADDNASGCAMVLELARLLAEERQTNSALLKRGLIFALWSGEEMGVLGSSHFAEHPMVPLSNIVANINFDMVGRLRDNKLMLQGVGSSGAWRSVIEKRNVAAGFNIVLQDDPYLPTDVTPFYARGVPVISFFTGSHDDYHRPTDTRDKINLEGMERIVRLARGLVLDVANAPQRADYVKVATTDRNAGGRENLRAYLGTIPDYATEVQGVKLSGVRAGSPAEKAGLKGGDVIVEFAGQKVANIYDYTYALDAVKIGQPVKIIITRDGQRVTIEATPEVRK